VNVTPKTLDFFDELSIRLSFGDEGVWIECGAIAPPSAIGRTVYLYLPDEISEVLLRELRRRAIHRRRKPLSEPQSPGTVSELRPSPQD
jgi:hypothetical protein